MLEQSYMAKWIVRGIQPNMIEMFYGRHIIPREIIEKDMLQWVAIFFEKILHLYLIELIWINKWNSFKDYTPGQKMYVKIKRG